MTETVETPRRVARLAATSAILLVLSGAPAAARPCWPQPDDDCALSEIFDGIDAAARQANEAQSAAAGKKAAAETEKAARSVIGANIAEGTPQPFGTRIHNTYQNFLNLLNVGVNQLEESEGGNEFVVRWNLLRDAHQKVAVALAVAEPHVGQVVSDAIPQAIRDATVSQIEKSMSDLDNTTWSLAYTFESRACDPGRTKCWGRNPATYRQALSLALTPIFRESPSLIGPDDRIAKLKSQLMTLVEPLRKKHQDILDRQRKDQVFNVLDIKWAEIDQKSRNAVARTLVDWQALERTAMAADAEYYAGYDFAALEALIDNQPQLAFTVSHHDPGTLGGPIEDGVVLEYQRGLENLNSIASGPRAGEDWLAARLRRKPDGTSVSTDKIVVRASYKKMQSYAVDSLGITPPPAGFTPVDRPDSKEYLLSAQWGRELPATVAGRPPRFDFSLEGIRATDDDVRTKDRLVSTATFTVPLGLDVSIPFSLTYANKPEFLDGASKQIGLHFGVTYRLPWRADRVASAAAGN